MLKRASERLRDQACALRQAQHFVPTAVRTSFARGVDCKSERETANLSFLKIYAREYITIPREKISTAPS